MKADQFCYWLQGLFELGTPVTLDEAQTDLVKRHLNMVFLHDLDQRVPEGEQTGLNAAHAGEHKVQAAPIGNPVYRC